METYISSVSNANNMVEVSGIIAAATGYFLAKYAREVAPAPEAKTGMQGKWITDATTYFRDQIMAFRQEIIDHIPERLKRTELYKKLTAQYLNC